MDDRIMYDRHEAAYYHFRVAEMSLARAAKSIDEPWSWRLLRLAEMAIQAMKSMSYDSHAGARMELRDIECAARWLAEDLKEADSNEGAADE